MSKDTGIFNSARNLVVASVLYPVWMLSGFAPSKIYADRPTWSLWYSVLMLLGTERMNAPDWRSAFAVAMVALLPICLLFTKRWIVGILLSYSVLNLVHLYLTPVSVFWLFYVLALHFVRQLIMVMKK